MSFTDQFLQSSVDLIRKIKQADVEAIVDLLVKVRARDGRLFWVNAAKWESIESFAPASTVEVILQ